MTKTDLSEYSGFLRDVAEYCGAEVADEVHDRLKGTNFIVPLEVDETHVLWRLKPETRKRFMEVFNTRERIYIPMKKQNVSRRELAKELAAQKFTHIEIGLELGCTTRWVHELLGGGAKKVDERQGDLFLEDKRDGTKG